MSDKRIETTRSEEVRSYAGIWTMPLKIYAIEKTKLIIPVGIWDALFFVVWELIFLMIDFFVPMFKSVPISVKFVLLPYVLMKFMMFVKLEGKQPHKYFYDLLIFSIFPKKYEYFEPSKELKKISFKNSKIYFTTYK